jgi:protein involved in ribonucleotide reduction
VYGLVYFSNISENTKRFVEKLGLPATRIPLKCDKDGPLVVAEPYVLFVPTYGGGNDSHTIPKQVKKFLNIEANRNLLRGVVGLGNTNFGDHYCKAAEMIAAKTGVPLLYRVEILGTPDDVEQVTERLEQLWITTAITN